MSKKLKCPKWHDIKEAKLREALLPATKGFLTKNEAYCLVIAAAQSMQQGSSTVESVPKIIDEMFEGEPICGFTKDFVARMNQRLRDKGFRT